MTQKRPRPSRLWTLLGLAALAAALLAAASPAIAAPLYDVKATWGPTNLPPGGEGQFEIQVRNLSTETGTEALTITDQLPAGVKARSIRWLGSLGKNLAVELCSGANTSTVTCEAPVELLGGRENGRGAPTGYLPLIEVPVKVAAAASGSGTNTATVSGGGGAEVAADTDDVAFSATPAPFGIVPGSFLSDFFDREYPFGEPSRTAGAHPFEQRVDFDITAHLKAGEEFTRVFSDAPIRTVEVTLPRGMIGNPEALPKCDPVDFAEGGSMNNSTACPANTQVGYLSVMLPGNGQSAGLPNSLLGYVPIYNLKPPRGTLADLAFNAAGYVQGHIYAVLDPAQDYAIKTVTPEISAKVITRGAEVTIWGVPGDPAHDTWRYYPAETEGKTFGAPFGGAPIRPFLTNPMDCGFANGGARVRVDSYAEPGSFTLPEEYPSPDNVEKCNDARFRFEPEVALQPTDRHAGAPTGLDVNLKIRQQNDEVGEAWKLYPQGPEGKKTGPEAIATPPLKKVVVTLPKGMTVSPSAAPGLEACTLEQIGIELREGRYVPNDKPVTCPDASQYGTLRLKSPALPQDHTIEGRVYIAQPYDNPFGSFLALYLAIEDEELGLQVKLAGEVRLDPVTGQITTEFDDLPQLPASEVEMKVKGGLRAGLVNPQTCGRKTIEATFYSWQDPNTPHPVKSSYDITQRPDGSPCPGSLAERPFEPLFGAGTLNPTAAAFSPLAINFSRTDDDQELSAVDGTAPPGLLASLRGVGRCSEAQIEVAANPARTGTEELNSPSCPASSQVGTVDAGAGVGQVLTWVKGRVYLAGPYEGAPASGVAIVPAVAGPFDLGVVVTQAPAYVDPVTAQISLKTDPLPQIFKGVPVRVRDIRVHLDRQNFTLNPTSCEAMSIDADLFSSEGKSKAVSQRYQAADCASLGFKPKHSFALVGGTRRGAHPALRASVRPRPGDANLDKVVVRLPHSAFLDQAHIRTICTRVQYAAAGGHGAGCPPASAYGHVTAYTPLFDQPLEGPVYLRSSSHNLPDMVLSLHGPPSLPIAIEAVGRIDSAKGGIRSSFEAIPDAPLSEVNLEMEGGKKGLIVNSTDLCGGTHRANASLAAHNGKVFDTKPPVRATGCKKHKKHGAHRKRHHG